MSDAAAAAPAPAKKATKKTAAKPKKPAEHPKVQVMVCAAIKALKERNGSSTQAIKKYIAANYKCDMAKMNPHVKKCLKTCVEKKVLVQVKGTGASGSFKLNAKAKEDKPKPAKKPAAKKPAAKKPAAKKAAKPKTAVKKPAAKKTPKKATKPKAATKKPKTPKKPAAKKVAKKPATKKPAAKKTPAKK